MNVQQLKYIISVGETLSFGKAAEKCFVTQPTLSTMIARFEDEIGIIVFDRKTKPITITKEGEKIINQLKVVIKDLENLDEIANDQR
jgi:LysR family hydrogen peroxide-inducible transcriptional activator